MSDVDRLPAAVMAGHEAHQFEGILVEPHDMKGLQQLSPDSAPLE
jgi:hypothetical protein